MNKLFIFAIGGTGERVLRSTTMFLAAGVPAFNDYDIYPIIIDYDADNKDKERTRDLLGAYKKINRIAYKNHDLTSMPLGDSNKGQFFGCALKELNGLEDFVLDFNPGEENVKFRDKIGFDLMTTKELRNTQLLIKSLYDTSDNPTTELNLNLKDGFKGNPNVGSVIFHKLGEYSEFESFVSTYDAGNGDKVVIIGSLFGGTGASGIPVLAQQIKKKIPNVDMSALMILPYFAPAIKKGGAINAGLFDSKTKAALNFYEKEIKQYMKAIYYIGDPYPTVVPYSEGGPEQRNNANPVEVIGALAIAHYCGNIIPNGIFGNEYLFGLSRDIDSTIDNTGKQDSCRIFLTDFDVNSQSNVLNYLTSFAISLKYFRDEILADKLKKETAFLAVLDYESIKVNVKNRQFSDNATNKLQDLLIRLNEYVDEFTGWLSELDYAGDDQNHIQPNSHRFAFYDFDKDISEIIVKPKESDKKKTMGIGQALTKILNSSPKINLTPLMNSHLKDRKHLDETGKKLNGDSEYVFMDILRASSMEIVNKNNS